MNTNFKLLLKFLLMIPFAICIIGTHQLFAQQKTTKANNQKAVSDKVVRIAVVTDTDGKEFEVTDLTAVYYLPHGFRFSDGGYPAPKKINSIGICLSFNEGRIWTHDNYNFTFDSILSIVSEVKGVLSRIVLIDSSVITRKWDTDVKKNVVEQTGAKGFKKRTECNEIHYKAGDFQGQGFYLREFQGHAKGASGKEGDFSISIEEVKQIVFRPIKQ